MGKLSSDGRFNQSRCHFQSTSITVEFHTAVNDESFPSDFFVARFPNLSFSLLLIEGQCFLIVNIVMRLCGIKKTKHCCCKSVDNVVFIIFSILS